jgi:ubiquinone/menaquinone biosynthesis C-methylase UbiE
VDQYSPAQEHTRESFGYKWSRRETYESSVSLERIREWLIERFCGGDPEQVDRWLSGGTKVILDAGCGAGVSALELFGDRLKQHRYIGVDISDSIDIARDRFARYGIPGEFMQHDVMDVPLPDESVDVVFSEGVLHHTDDTERALSSLARKLKPDGRFLFYVYRKKGAIREFTDDHIRAALSQLSNEQAWQSLEPLTRLGKSLGELNVQIEVPETIPYLGIEAGRYDLQRFFHYNICKMFYRSDYSIDEMNHVNFDWFRPLNCHRHTPAEVERFCRNAGLNIERIHVEEAGITVVGVKRP